MKDRYDSIVAILCAALDLRDNVTQGHARRVSEIASVVAWQMGLRKEQLRQIEKAAILHDIGKIGVADAVLSKPGPLNESEWEEMRRHPELGRQVLNGIDFLRDAGRGGLRPPRALGRPGLPVRPEGRGDHARCAYLRRRRRLLRHDFPPAYRKAIPHSRAIDEILRNAGGQFDPAVVRVFAEAERKQGLIDEEQHNGHGRRSGRRVLQRGEQIAAAAGEEAPLPYEEIVPAAGE